MPVIPQLSRVFFFFKAITINRSIEESQTYLILEVLLINLYLYLIFAL